MQNLQDLGDAGWWITPTKQTKIAEPKPGYILTVDVQGYGRPCIIFFPAGGPRPKLNVRTRVKFEGGKLVFPVRK